MWVTERTATAGCYTIGDRWYAGGSGHERSALVGNPHASWVFVSFPILVSVPGVSRATGQAKRRWQMGTQRLASLCCQLAWRRQFTRYHTVHKHTQQHVYVLAFRQKHGVYNPQLCTLPKHTATYAHTSYTHTNTLLWENYISPSFI